MAAASTVGDGGGFALAEGSEIRFCRPCSAPGPGIVASRLAHERAWRARTAARTRRSLAASGAVAAANDAATGRRPGRAAGSNGEPFQNPAIGAHDSAGLVRAPGGDGASPF